VRVSGLAKPRPWLFRLARGVAVAILVVLLLPYLLVPLYRVINPVSTLMLWRWAKGARVERSFVPIARMAPALPITVIASEDGRFCTHRGVDWRELRERLEDVEDIGEARAVSTITQQTAKNLFLWPGRSFLRKGLELPLALWIDLVQPLRVQQIGTVAHPVRGGLARCGAAEPATAQRQAAGTGGAPPRRHLRGPRRGPGSACVLCEVGQACENGAARSRPWP